MDVFICVQTWASLSELPLHEWIISKMEMSRRGRQQILGYFTTASQYASHGGTTDNMSNGSDTGSRKLTGDDGAAPARLTIALAWIAARKSRDRVFASPLFHNPAWDILLDIYVHRSSSQTCINHVSAASSSPPTTVLRWIGVLESEGLIERQRDPNDRRRTILRLTALGLGKMEETLDAATASDKRLGLGRLRVVQ